MDWERVKTINGVSFYRSTDYAMDSNLGEIQSGIYQDWPDPSIHWFKLHYRCVAVDNLERIEESGIDVVPIDAPFFCDEHLSKTLEYGGWPKVVLGLEPSLLKPSHVVVPVDTPPEEIEELSRIYPVAEKTVSGESIWLSRRNEDDCRRGTPYEELYSRWIEVSPWECLKIVIILDLAFDQVDRA